MRSRSLTVRADHAPGAEATGLPATPDESGFPRRCSPERGVVRSRGLQPRSGAGENA
jgi:hypothetical protein